MKYHFYRSKTCSRPFWIGPQKIKILGEALGLEIYAGHFHTDLKTACEHWKTDLIESLSTSLLRTMAVKLVMEDVLI
jgi:hypothetical protein